ncbi:tRNA pseudouridine(13) synthase TruD [Moraxella oblonga]|uniref:tRNA pseudouridine(13) synthase TruD n=1 Tax=Moraxella oblonga TaxID=200413 RepID=UPI00082CA336|nr:tRNA pseudouridine(13) synthase TruD [Moraxella oblonga]
MNHQHIKPSISLATFKQLPTDFIVTELLDIEFSQKGEHCWFYIHKTNLNTAFVAKLLSQWANIPLSDIGFSGLKDRRASTYQWFSLRLPKQELPHTDFINFTKAHLNPDESLSIIKIVWHHKKLGRGTHKHNHFNITLRQVVGHRNDIEKQLNIIHHQGIPNYFGHQRFGIEQSNIEHTKQFFEQLLSTDKPYKPNKKDVQKHGMYISVAKSLLFNAILSKRVNLNCWDKPIEGDVFNLNGTGSIFTSSIDDDIIKRMADKDIHPTILLFGTGDIKHTDDSLALHQDIFNLPQFDIFIKGLLKVNSKLSYRATRLLIQDLSWEWQDDNLVLDFILPSGTFATCVIDVLVDDVRT